MDRGIGTSSDEMLGVRYGWWVYGHRTILGTLKKFKDILAKLIARDLCLLVVRKSTPYRGCCLQSEEIRHYH